MGLLDDAIREHLDLKRRRGADPAEIERAEREALGPVRRGPEDEALPEFDELQELPIVEDDSAVAGAEDYDPFEGDRPLDDLRQQPEVYRFEDEVSVEDGTPSQPPTTYPSDAERAANEAPRPVPARAPEDIESPSSRRGRGAGGETVEWDVERALQEESDVPQDDVLEETPEFLQDAPEHDRLWFEQRPPRDFDFNG
ncbi:MAG: hypothetical protein ACLP8S_34425 [Solirubrobacteraceae bacterium]